MGERRRPIVFRRVPSAETPRLGVFHAGAAAVDVTPHPGMPLAGYSVGGPTANGARGRLFARATVFDDGRGGRLAFVVADLHSGSRYVNEKAASLVAGSHGLGIDRLVVFGTHTHTGFGCVYGDSFYDRMAADGGDFDGPLADRTAEKIAGAVRDACAALRPARLRVAGTTLRGVVRNRALKAARRNPEFGPLVEPYDAVDDRLTIWAGVPLSSTDPLVVFALYGAHATALGASENRFEPDWPARAASYAARELGRNGGEWRGAFVSLANGSAGDVTPLGFNGLSQSVALADAVGREVGAAIVRAASEPGEGGDDPAPLVACRFDEAPFVRPGSLFARRPSVGYCVIGGAEDGRSGFFDASMAEGRPTFEWNTKYRSDPRQIPKTPVCDAAIAETFARELLLLRPSPFLPLRVAILGRSTIVCLPFEPTVVAARRVESSVGKVVPSSAIRVVGYAGGFNGYLTTPEEYDVQLYEGGHTLWGRESLPETASRCAALAATTPSPPEPEARFPDVYRDPTAAMFFNGGAPRDEATFVDRAATPDGDQVAATFVVRGLDPMFDDGPWAVVEARGGDGAFAPAVDRDGVRCDDASGFASIGDRRRTPADDGTPDRFRYEYRFRAPLAELRALDADLRVRLMFPRGNRLSIPIRF